MDSTTPATTATASTASPAIATASATSPTAADYKRWRKAVYSARNQERRREALAGVPVEALEKLYEQENDKWFWWGMLAGRLILATAAIWLLAAPLAVSGYTAGYAVLAVDFFVLSAAGAAQVVSSRRYRHHKHLFSIYLLRSMGKYIDSEIEYAIDEIADSPYTSQAWSVLRELDRSECNNVRDTARRQWLEQRWKTVNSTAFALLFMAGSLMPLHSTVPLTIRLGIGLAIFRMLFMIVLCMRALAAKKRADELTVVVALVDEYMAEYADNIRENSRKREARLRAVLAQREAEEAEREAVQKAAESERGKTAVRVDAASPPPAEDADEDERG